MDTDSTGQFDLNEFAETILKLYHDGKEGDVEEAGKQSEANVLWVVQLWVVPVATSAGHR